jgi:hypothetical protein
MAVSEEVRLNRAVETILNDFPKATSSNTRNVAPSNYSKKTNTEPTQRRKDTVTQLPVTAKKAVTSAPVIIRNGSGISTYTLEYGYLNIINNIGIKTVSVWSVSKNEKRMYKELQLQGQKEKLRLPEGKYILSVSGYGDYTFKIEKRMITDVRLR